MNTNIGLSMLRYIGTSPNGHRLGSRKCSPHSAVRSSAFEPHRTMADDSPNDQADQWNTKQNIAPAPPHPIAHHPDTLHKTHASQWSRHHDAACIQIGTPAGRIAEIIWSFFSKLVAAPTLKQLFPLSLSPRGHIAGYPFRYDPRTHIPTSQGP